jgi:hypothetical protein
VVGRGPSRPPPRIDRTVAAATDVKIDVTTVPA